jgi:hypothetical protein
MCQPVDCGNKPVYQGFDNGEPPEVPNDDSVTLGTPADAAWKDDEPFMLNVLNADGSVQQSVDVKPVNGVYQADGLELDGGTYQAQVLTSPRSGQDIAGIVEVCIDVVSGL